MTDQQIRKKRWIGANIWTGLIFILVGAALLLRQSGYPLPDWLFNWEIILILAGIVIGVRNRFQDWSWLIMVVIGVVFLSDDLWPGIKLRQYAWPIVIIALGLIFILAPKSACKGRRRFRGPGFPSGENPSVMNTPPQDYNATQDTAIDIVSIFSGIKKKVLSKQFRGGEIVCVFGGAEINLAHSDFNSPIVIDVVNIFGGTKLVVPSNWEIRSELTAIFGGVDDKRPPIANIVPEKTIILNGTIMFGGIEVNSF